MKGHISLPEKKPEKKPQPDYSTDEFHIGDRVLCIQPDTAGYPIEVGKTYTITNMRYEETWDWEYEIENYNEQIFDYFEFKTFFVIDPIYKLQNQRKDKLKKINKINEGTM